MSEKNCCAPKRDEKNPLSFISSTPKNDIKNLDEMKHIEAGSFFMGTDYELGFLSDGEGPVREINLSEFYIDKYPITNLNFDKFCQNTGYLTEAEKYGWSFVFYKLISDKTKKNISESVSNAPWWLKVDLANWRNPYGPDSNILDLENHPVVHISWNDALAYANWIGKDLPTEAEWECAARGGLEKNLYSWGNENIDISEKCNIWNGEFPETNTLIDGWLGTSPVNYFKPNNFDIYDSSGNVWEWTNDWFSSSFHTIERKETRYDPKGPNYGTSKTMKGGSYLCNDSYCNRYRVAARTQNTPDSSTGNLGFRLVYRNK